MIGKLSMTMYATSPNIGLRGGDMEIIFEKLAKVIFEEMIPRIENNIGVSIFAKERAKFEGWLKVELCGSLSKYFPSITPEKDRIDITFDNWVIELKTVNTNYRYENVKNKTRPITNNIQGVIDDIEKLKSTNYINKAILFIVFPVTNNHETLMAQVPQKSMKIKPKLWWLPSRMSIVYLKL